MLVLLLTLFSFFMYSFTSSFQSDDTICTKSGLTCSLDCQQVILCMIDEISVQNVTYKKFLIENCSPGTFCDSRVGYCNKNLSKCPTLKHFCTGPGLFPDPYQCDQYHICAKENEEPIIHSCPQGYNYSASGACLKKQCTEIPTCSPTQVSTALVDNPSLYLVCEKQIFPRIYRCPIGFYDTILGLCIEPGELNHYELPFHCKRTGFFPTFDSDCYEYINCTESLEAIRSRCPLRMRFDEMLAQCVQDDKTIPCMKSNDADFKEIRFQI